MPDIRCWESPLEAKATCSFNLLIECCKSRMTKLPKVHSWEPSVGQCLDACREHNGCILDILHRPGGRQIHIPMVFRFHKDGKRFTCDTGFTTGLDGVRSGPQHSTGMDLGRLANLKSNRSRWQRDSLYPARSCLDVQSRSGIRIWHLLTRRGSQIHARDETRQ